MSLQQSGALASIEERENLLRTKSQPQTGFTSRRATRLATEKAPTSDFAIECNHIARLSSSDGESSSAPFEYQLWLLASQQPFQKPERPDPQFNTSVWRNLAQHYGVTDDASPRRRSGVKDLDRSVAAVYPLNVASPSRLGAHSFSRFVEDTKVFRERSRKLVALERARTEEKTMTELRIKSESRVPPVDLLGNILPPESFEKHSSYDWSQQAQRPSTPPARGLSPDLFGNMVKRRPVRLWKLSYQDNHPGISDILYRRHEAMRRHRQMGAKPNFGLDFDSAADSLQQSPQHH